MVLNAGLNLLYTSTWYDFKISPVKDYSKTYEDVTFVWTTLHEYRRCARAVYFQLCLEETIL